MNCTYKYSRTLQIESLFLMKTDIFIHHLGQFFSPDSRWLVGVLLII